MSLPDLSQPSPRRSGPPGLASPEGNPQGPGPAPYPIVPLDLDAVDEQVAEGLTARSLAGLVSAALTGLLLWHLANGTGTTVHMLIAAPGAALGGSVFTVRVMGASLPTWARRLLVFLVSPRRYARGPVKGPGPKRPSGPWARTPTP